MANFHVHLKVLFIPTGEYLEVSFKYNDRLVAAFKDASAPAMGSRTFQNATNTWEIRLTDLSPEIEWELWTRLIKDFKPQALAAGYEWSPQETAKKRLEYLKGLRQKQSGVSRAVSVPTKLHDRSLYQHQMSGVADWTTAFKGRGILAWDPGTGKCTGAAAAMEAIQAGRVVIGCPEHAMLTWKRELGLLVDRPVFLYGRDEQAGYHWALTNNGVLVIGYSSLIKDSMDKLGRQLPFELLIVDECQMLKNHKAQRTKAVKKLSNRVHYFMPLSGTPAVSRPAELFSVLNMVDPQRWADFMTFAVRYCGAKKQKFGWDFSGSSNLEELHSLLSATCMHRARKADCTDLPKKIRIPVPVDIDNRAEYDKIAAGLLDTWVDLRGEEQLIHPDAMVRFGQLRQAAVKGKVADGCAWLVEWLTNNPDQKMVVFAHHKEVVVRIMEALAQAGIGANAITGDVDQEYRHKLVEIFQTPTANFRVLVGTIGAMGTALTMTAARYMTFFECTLTPGDQVQAEDRIDRIGAVGPSTYYYIVAEDTIDETVVRVLHKKAEVIATLLDGQASPDDQSVLADIFSDIGVLAKTRKANQQKAVESHAATLGLAPTGPVEIIGLDMARGEDSTVLVTAEHGGPDGFRVMSVEEIKAAQVTPKADKLIPESVEVCGVKLIKDPGVKDDEIVTFSGEFNSSATGMVVCFGRGHWPKLDALKFHVEANGLSPAEMNAILNAFNNRA